ncbi:cytochrome C assembly family protein [Alteromonas sp. ASW11-130]|uniref:cytochrome C assembly family protein n=1 Tax=Alteromonas sp. ASW11-130 TaxID=3015775 RepID=UPI0022429A5D|nr:cytochrome c biogenesis protein CcsA [Alteromonas sp. ASW11-130]MCW8093037.1 cytochrome c biogenesis protein CcsA [Alteromonas sp. ASW11-130]
MTTLFALLSIAMYLISMFVLMGRLFHKDGPNKTVALSLAAVGTVVHILYLADAIMGVPGQNMSITNVLSLVAWLITVSMLISITLLPNVMLLPGVLGFAALSVTAVFIIPAEHIMHIELQPGLLIHISLSLFAYGTLVIAFLYALQMSYITHRLKQKEAAFIYSTMPPLTLVEGILFKLLLVGTCLLIIAQISGFIFLDNMFSKLYAHKTLLSLAATAIYILLLVGQRMWGWRGKQVIGLTVLGLALLSMAYFGSRFVREILL